MVEAIPFALSVALLMNLASAADASPPVPPADSRVERESINASASRSTLRVDARKHCIDMGQTQRPDEFAAKRPLKRNQRYTVTVEGSAYLSQHRGSKADPMPGVVLFYCTNSQDGYATEYTVLKPGESLSFQTPQARNADDVFLSAFFLDYWPESENRGEYELTIDEESDDPDSRIRGETELLEDSSQVSAADREERAAGMRSILRHRPVVLNLTFANKTQSDSSTPDDGERFDVWNFVEVGRRKSVGLRLADGTPTDVVAEISENDGAWGIAGVTGPFHGYLYHNCQCVDLSVTLRYLPPGIYEAFVFAHGDAPDQNAAVEIASAGVTYSGKSTLKDGTTDFRQTTFTDGNQYVRYVVDVQAGSPLVVTSKRDGSSYSMINALTLRRIAP